MSTWVVRQSCRGASGGPLQLPLADGEWSSSRACRRNLPVKGIVGEGLHAAPYVGPLGYRVFSWVECRTGAWEVSGNYLRKEALGAPHRCSLTLGPPE
jgi:hypothetical protein